MERRAVQSLQKLLIEKLRFSPAIRFVRHGNSPVSFQASRAGSVNSRPVRARSRRALGEFLAQAPNGARIAETAQSFVDWHGRRRRDNEHSDFCCVERIEEPEIEGRHATYPRSQLRRNQRLEIPTARQIVHGQALDDGRERGARPFEVKPPERPQIPGGQPDDSGHGAPSPVSSHRRWCAITSSGKSSSSSASSSAESSSSY